MNEQSTTSAPGSTSRLLLIAFFCGLPTVSMLQRFSEVAAPTIGLGPGLLVTLLVAVWAVLLCLVLRYALPQLQRPGSWRVSPDMLFLLGLAVLFVLYLVIYPLADSGTLGFYSDRDEAIDVGARQLLQGEHPYSCRVVSGLHHGCLDQGNPILPMPGALVLSLPFVMLAGSAIQVFFWLGLLYLAVRQMAGDARQALLYLATLFLLCPILLAEILTGGDLISNTLAVSSLCLLLLNSKHRGHQLMLAVLLGMALSWRAHFVLLFFPLLGYYLAAGRAGEFLRLASATAFGFALVTLPLYLWDPGQFTPLRSSEKLSDFSHILPRAELVVPLVSALLGLVLGAQTRNVAGVLLACGFTVIVPALAAVALQSIKLGHPSLLFYGWYTLSGLIFGTIGAFQRNPKLRQQEDEKSCNSC